MSYLLKIALVSLFFFAILSCQEEVQPFTDYRQDVSPVKIIDEQLFVSGTTTLNDYSSRVTRTIIFPSKTKYWVIWVGVGQESINKLKEAAVQIPKAAQNITRDPFIAFGLNILSSLPIITGSDNINFYFTDSANSQKFKNGEQFRYFTFVQGEQTVNKYQIIPIGDTPYSGTTNLYMNFQNLRAFRNLDVFVKVWAYVEK